MEPSPTPPHSSAAESRGRRSAFLTPFQEFRDQIAAMREADVYCVFPEFDAVEPGVAWIGGRRSIVLVANNYLGLALDPRVRRAARDAIDRFGTSGCASPLAGGYTSIHHELERRLAALLDQEEVVLTASGYQANLALIAALMQPDDLIVSDLCNHASIVDGARLSGAELRFFQHNNPDHLEAVLARAGAGRRMLVIAEGVYSVDGDIAPLPGISEAAEHHGALLMVDEAHSLGTLGDGGRGAVAHFGLERDVDLIMGTLSKSLGSVGGFAAGDRDLIDHVRHAGRALVFSAALPAAGAAAALEALNILESEPELLSQLWRNTDFVLSGLRARGFDTLASATPVILILTRDERRTAAFTARLRDRGVLVCPVGPPMVPRHRWRVRLHVTAAHSRGDLEVALDILDEVAREVDVPRLEAAASAGAAGGVRA